MLFFLKKIKKKLKNSIFSVSSKKKTFDVEEIQNQNNLKRFKTKKTKKVNFIHITNQQPMPIVEECVDDTAS